MVAGSEVHDLPDEILARRAAEGRTDCFEEILSRYRDRVYRICYRMAGNAEDAEDWAQECFVIASI
jgi:RNA polymerase sigma-70 factor (ECF subfamily)